MTYKQLVENYKGDGILSLFNQNIKYVEDTKFTDSVSYGSDVEEKSDAFGETTYFKVPKINTRKLSNIIFDKGYMEINKTIEDTLCNDMFYKDNEQHIITEKDNIREFIDNVLQNMYENGAHMSNLSLVCTVTWFEKIAKAYGIESVSSIKDFTLQSPFGSLLIKKMSLVMNKIYMLDLDYLSYIMLYSEKDKEFEFGEKYHFYPSFATENYHRIIDIE